jgi:hypothetical protein
MVTELVEAHAGTASINDMAATKFFIDFTFPADPARQQIVREAILLAVQGWLPTSVRTAAPALPTPMVPTAR